MPQNMTIECMTHVEELNEWACTMTTPDIYKAEAWLNRRIKGGEKAYYMVTITEPSLIRPPPDVDMDDDALGMV